MTDTITTDITDGVLHIAITRPEKKNALTRDMYDTMTAALVDAASNEAVRSVLLSGGDEIFTAGNDLADFAARQVTTGEKSPAWDFLCALSNLNRPVVAAIKGPAIGIGATLLLHVDLVYAQEGSYIHMPFTDLAAVPEGAASYYLPRRFGPQVAAEFILLGERVDAQRACEMGLVNKVITDGDVRDYAKGIAVRLANKPPKSLQRSKELIMMQRDQMFEHMSLEFEEFGKCLASEEMQAVVAAMRGK